DHVQLALFGDVELEAHVSGLVDTVLIRLLVHHAFYREIELRGVFPDDVVDVDALDRGQRIDRTAVAAEQTGDRRELRPGRHGHETPARGAAGRHDHLVAHSAAELAETLVVT